MDVYDLDNFPTGRSAQQQFEERTAAERFSRPASFIIVFAIMICGWILLSGKMDYFHLGLGAVSSAMVAHFSRDLLFNKGRVPKSAFKTVRGMTAYAPWLLWQILLANIHVLFLALSPGMEENINPHILRLDTRLKTELGLVTLANSITLTPGTITVYISETGTLAIHAIDYISSDPDTLHAMEEKVMKACREAENG